ncbi:MAG: V-type ATP synthase subunit C [bacterium]
MTKAIYQERKDDLRYAFAVGKIRAMEARLLEGIVFKRLIEAKDSSEMTRILAETLYGELLKEGASGADFEALLNMELIRTYQLIKNIDPDPESPSNLLAMRYDFHNLKVCLKLRTSLKEANPFLISLGVYGPEAIRHMVASGDYSSFPPGIAQALVHLVSELDKLSPPSQWIDIQIDHIAFHHLLQEARLRSVMFLAVLFRLQIDLINLKTFLRVKQMGKDRSFLHSVLIEGGEISPETLLSLLDEPLNKVISSLGSSPYAGIIREGIESYQKEGSLALLEKLIDDFMITFIHQTRYITFGAEPLIAYLLAKENEIKNLRIVIVGKQNKLPQSLIEERLRKMYG